jgi:glycosyltransferase involved in cell wall biosynthesis
MKQDIFKGLKISNEQAKNAVKKIKNLEVDLAKDCSIVIAVSESDANEYKTMGAKRVVLAPNGISQPSAVRRNANKSAFPRESQYIVDRRILFVGSGHPPNWVGFEKMVGIKLGFLPPKSRIYLVGGISDHFVRVIKRRTTQDVTFWQRAIACGLVSEKRLTNLLSDCDLIILPITEGGGSNLKTAEAFVADKNIVATSYAMRTYEYLDKLPNLYIADTPQKFREAILKAISESHKERSNNERELVKRVLWDNCLNELIKQVSLL